MLAQLQPGRESLAGPRGSRRSRPAVTASFGRAGAGEAAEFLVEFTRVGHDAGYLTEDRRGLISYAHAAP